MKTEISCGVLLLGVLVLPLAVSAQTYTRTEVMTYYDNTNKWVLGQVAKVTCVAPTTALPAGCGVLGTTISETTFDPVYALPLTSKSFGKLQQTLTYDTTSTVASGQLGTLKTVKDGNNNVTTLSSWKRGIPQSIKFPITPESPSGAVQSAVVNDSGWITSVTDENGVGFTTNYQYDAMGRLSRLLYPISDSTVWNDTILAFEPVAAAEYGISAGHWRQTVSTGNNKKIAYYDALWRPLVVETYDAKDAPTIAATRSVSVIRYDVQGRPIFQSYPSSSLVNYAGASLTGLNTFYDALGRQTSVSQDSELGTLTTTTEYLSGFKTRVTNPRLQQTTTSYMAWDQPSYDLPVAITHPEVAFTDITRNMFGKPTALIRRNSASSLAITRSYDYNTAQELCRTVEPETGATLMGYDGAGNLAWSAIGLPAGTACDPTGTTPAVVARKASRTYDARNRVKTLLFPDGRDNQSWAYTPDGLPASITNDNAPGNEQVISAYTYNKRRMMIGESMTQAGWYTWSIGYGYDGIGNLSTQVYQGGSSVSYAPNALGQATQVKDSTNYVFASGAQYYPNGALKQFTYGNGLTHVMTQNARQLPQRSTDSGGVLDHEYVYDPNANVQYIYDQRNPADHRYLYYDGLDRLTSAGSQMFGGDHWHRFTYDILDNLKSWKLAGVKDYAEYVYDAKNQLTNIKNSAGASIVGLSYDPHGNLTNKNGQGYEFNYGNRMRAVTGKESFRYDGQGRRIMAWSPTLGGIFSQYTADGKLFFQEDQRSGTRWLFHLYLGGNLVAIRETSTAGGLVTRYQHTDALGSPVAVSNEAGVVVERNNYEPYGAIIGKPNYGGVGFTGHAQDAATGLTYMQQRYYDPMIGRFLSVDPVTANSGTGANFNRYWYANNNPYKFTDPDGRQSAADRFGETYPTLTSEQKAPLEAVAVQVTATALAITPVIGPILTLSFRQAVQDVKGPSVAGVEIGKTPSQARAALEKAGYEGKPISNPSGTETGTLHNVPNMKMDVRVMNGGTKHEPRVVTNVQGSKQPANPADGKNFGNIPKAEQLEKSHMPLRPDKLL